SKDYVIQCFFDNDGKVEYDNIILIKRSIEDNDSYTFIDRVDYNYLDMTLDDLIEVIKRKYVHQEVYVSSNDTLNNISNVKSIDFKYIKDTSDEDNNFSYIFKTYNGLVDKSFRCMDINDIAINCDNSNDNENYNK